MAESSRESEIFLTKTIAALSMYTYATIYKPSVRQSPHIFANRNSCHRQCIVRGGTAALKEKLSRFPRGKALLLKNCT
jgi:hypothetical protein